VNSRIYSIMTSVGQPRPTLARIRNAVFLGTLLTAAACREAVPPRMDASLVAAGDIASCWWRWDDATGRLLDHIDGVVVGLGDMVYQAGTAAQFSGCYSPNWGRHRSRTRVVIGNHDGRTEKGAPFYAYFGAAAGVPGKGWYSWDQEGWHIVGLNSEVAIGAGSEQLRWLEADLRAHPALCTLAFVHRPAFSSTSTRFA
jgi:acid phosphatase type 7